MVNDSAQQFIDLQLEMIHKAEGISNYLNPITKHFSKYISQKDLDKIEFKESKKNVYLEFTLDNQRNTTSISSNANTSALDKHLKKAFKKLNRDLLKIDQFNSRYKYTLIIIQNIENTAVIKCSHKPIGYIPPVYNHCSDNMNNKDLHDCNYTHITTYINNNIDLSSVTALDIDNDNIILPKFIIDKEGKVIAAKVEAENKELVEAYYRVLLALPKADSPAKLNGINYYYGYNFPTSVEKIILYSSSYRKFFYRKRFEMTTHKELMKEFIEIEYDVILE